MYWGSDIKEEYMNKLRYMAPVILAAVIFASCGEAPEQDFAGSGIIEATEITISAKTTGTIFSSPPDEGSEITEGDLIAVIDVEMLELQRAVSEADLADIEWSERVLKAQRDLVDEQISQASLKNAYAAKTQDRVVNLFDAGAATADRLDAVETELAVGISALKSAELQQAEVNTRLGALAAKRQKVNASLALLSRQIEDGNVTAPCSGVLLETYKETGELSVAGQPLCTVAEMDTVTVRIYVNETMLGSLVLGSNAKIAIDSHPGERFPATVTWISPEAEFTPKNVQTRDARADLVYAVEITIPNPDGLFKIGMPADAYLKELAGE
jgi:HlyD family secretion protein